MKFIKRVILVVCWVLTLFFLYCHHTPIIISFSTYYQTMYNSFGNEKLKYDKKKIQLFHGRKVSPQFESFYNHASDDELMDPFIHQHRYKLLLNNVVKCKGKHVFLLVFIHIAPVNFAKRSFIRSTFGSILSFHNKRIEHVFVLGKTKNATLQQEIEHESNKYMDIIQGNFIDSYRNLTYKLIFSLFWVNNFCKNAKFVIKMDDDIIINIPLVVPYLAEKVKAGKTVNVLECKTIKENIPVRERNNKWFITPEEYPFTKFLPYCAGHSSIMSIDVVRKMYKASKNVPYLWLEDVYGSGFLSLLLKLNMFMPKFYFEPVLSGLYKIPCSLFYLNILKNDSNALVLWNTITKYEKRLNCMY
ncbi:beta-1,3-galactosyltransferase 5-like [Mytilus californianus]|uniref:beta-1,3-galactosyltransferase 5-like n=1 Tax=Mytilus californianus TaxID=6549 RepID=UPI0022475F8D|nr:beta-1,3-galactosyltransferase 5-like [Mytilus californianus]